MIDYSRVGLRAAILVTFLLSCQKKEEKRPFYIDDYYKAHFNYQAGTYWVFLDHISGSVDSFALTYNRHELPYIYGDNPDERNTMTIRQYSFKRADTLIMDWMLYMSAESNLSLSADAGYNQSILRGTPPMIYESIHYKSRYGLYQLYRSEFLPTFESGGKTYYSVYKITGHYDSSNTGDTRYYNTYYLNADSGFIAILRNDNVIRQDMYLQRCKIVR